jgi:hypothetical protein
VGQRASLYDNENHSPQSIPKVGLKIKYRRSADRSRVVVGAGFACEKPERSGI